VAPPKTVKEERVDLYAQHFADAIKDLQGLDGVNVYDIQEEKGRTEDERPFPFLSTWEPRFYAKLVRKHLNIEILLYCAITDHPKETLDEWLHSTYMDHNVGTLVLVGRSSGSEQPIGYSVIEAAKYIKEHEPRFILGGITIPERHRDKGKEHKLLFAKYEQGVSFFTSQLVYHSDNAISVLADYDELCRTWSKTSSNYLCLCSIWK